jgi:hypothetical protein
MRTATMGLCVNCKFWKEKGYKSDGPLRICTRAERLWEASKWSDDLIDDYGRPLLVFKDPTSRSFVEDRCDDYAALLTMPDFGCTLWERK